jgi:hypothetical protein
MPTIAGTRPRRSTQVETKEEAKAIVDAGLAVLVKKRNNFDEQSGSVFVRIVKYCRDNETSRETVIETLRANGYKESSAKAEASLIKSRGTEKYAQMLEDAENGLITVREFRGVPKGRASEVDPEKRMINATSTAAKRAYEHESKELKEQGKPGDELDKEECAKLFGRLAREKYLEVAYEGGREEEEEEEEEEAEKE